MVRSPSALPSSQGPASENGGQSAGPGHGGPEQPWPADKLTPVVDTGTTPTVIRINGKNMLHRNHKYMVQFFDGEGHHVGTDVVKTDRDRNFKKPAVYIVTGTEKTGNWHVLVIPRGSYMVEAGCSFSVREKDIPEFPVGAAGPAVAGICTLIYLRLRKGRLDATA